ncbi:MAG: carbohydrate kinase family protein [Syntrophobacteraceae bacterium]
MLCVGHAAFDIVMSVERHPGPDEKCTATSMISCGGGPAANAAVAVARLGGRSAFLGYLATDPFGAQHHKELVRESVAVDWSIRGAHPSPISTILVKPDGSRTVVNHKSLTPYLSPEQVDLSGCFPRVVLFDGHEPEIGPAILKHAAGLEAKTVLDAGSVHRGTLELLPLVSFVIASQRFALDFARTDDPVAALRHLSRHTAWAAVTLGCEGVAWCDGSSVRKLNAHPVQPVDTTGAGDVFHGAFAVEIARGASVTRALQFANAAAAVACTRLGARPGAPFRDEVAAILANP